MPSVLGMTSGEGASTERLCRTDAADPLLDQFLTEAWGSALRRDRLALAGVPPGLYPLVANLEYEVVDRRVVSVSAEIAEASRDERIDEAFLDCLWHTGRNDPPSPFPTSGRASRTWLLLQVPARQGRSGRKSPAGRAPPEVMASFTHAAREVLTRLARSPQCPPGDHRLDLRVEPVGRRWRVTPAHEPTRLITALIGGLREAGLLLEGDHAGPVYGGQLSLVVRADRARSDPAH